MLPSTACRSPSGPSVLECLPLLLQSSWHIPAHVVPLTAVSLQALIKMFDPVLTWAARKYQAAVATELKKYGLRYEDLYDPQLNMVRTATHVS